MKKLTAFAVVAFMITLAVIVAHRMSSEAMAVVVGVVCGVAAAIPTSLLVAFVTMYRGQRREEEMARRLTPQPPSVVIVSGGEAHRLGAPPTGWGLPAYAAQEPEFTVLGEEQSS